MVLGLKLEENHVAYCGLDCVGGVDFGGAAYDYSMCRRGSRGRPNRSTTCSHGIHSCSRGVVAGVYPDQDDFCGRGCGDGLDAGVVVSKWLWSLVGFGGLHDAVACTFLLGRGL